MMAGRVKRPLGDIFGLTSFGVNHVTLSAGAVSALHHRHNVQDEFVFVISGTITLMHDAGETVLTAGMCAGFPRGGTAHHLVNRSGDDATYLEVGDRQPGDWVEYPHADIQAVMGPDGKWRFGRAILQLVCAQTDGGGLAVRGTEQRRCVTLRPNTLPAATAVL